MVLDEGAQGLRHDDRAKLVGERLREHGLARALPAEQPDEHHGIIGSVMERFGYVAVLGFVLVGCLWLEVALRTRVLRRWRRLLLAVVPAMLVFVVWDVYAIAQGHWTFDPARILGIHLPGDLPLDEVLFFLVIPLASVLTIEAVRSVKPHWRAGDES